MEGKKEGKMCGKTNRERKERDGLIFQQVLKVAETQHAHTHTDR